jgi:fatty acid/phospholipid biosynthesis enzyme
MMGIGIPYIHHTHHEIVIKARGNEREKHFLCAIESNYHSWGDEIDKGTNTKCGSPI